MLLLVEGSRKKECKDLSVTGDLYLEMLITNKQSYV